MIDTKPATVWRYAMLAFCLLTLTIARAAPQYGDVELVEGSAELIDAKGKSRAPRAGDKVYEGETMRTGKDGELHVKTSDSGLVALRANTQIKVEVYHADGDAEDTSVVSLLSGTLRTITGWIGKYQPKRVLIKTPMATIGIRGTDHEPLYVAPGEKSSLAPGTYDKVNTGGTYIESAAGRVAIDKGRAGFAPHDAKSAPKVLDKIPDLYRPTKNEERIRKRKDDLEREMDKARLERQKAKAAEKTGAAGKAESAEKTEKADASKADASKADATKADASKAEASKTETPKEEAHKKAERKRHRPADSK